MSGDAADHRVKNLKKLIETKSEFFLKRKALANSRQEAIASVSSPIGSNNNQKYNDIFQKLKILPCTPTAVRKSHAID